MSVIDVPGRLHSFVTGNELAGANEIVDDTNFDGGKKQSVINAELYSATNSHQASIENHETRLGDVEQLEELRISVDPEAVVSMATDGSVFTSTDAEDRVKIPTVGAVKDGVYNAIDAQTGYYVCETASNVPGKTIIASGFVLSKGCSIKVKMNSINTADNVTFGINSTEAKPLYYNGAIVSSSNSWEAGETVEIYIGKDNNNNDAYYANNVAGGGKFASGEKVKETSVANGVNADDDGLAKSGDVYTETHLSNIPEFNEFVADIVLKEGINITSHNKVSVYKWYNTNIEKYVIDVSLKYDNNTVLQFFSKVYDNEEDRDADFGVLLDTDYCYIVLRNADVHTTVNSTLVFNRDITWNSLNEHPVIKQLLTDKNVYTKEEVNTQINSINEKAGSWINNPEYLKVITDNSNRLLFAIKVDGSIEWSKGIPTPIKKILEENKIDSITTEEIGEYIFIINSKNNKRLFSINAEGLVDIPNLKSVNVIDTRLTAVEGKLNNKAAITPTIFEQQKTAIENAVADVTFPTINLNNAIDDPNNNEDNSNAIVNITSQEAFSNLGSEITSLVSNGKRNIIISFAPGIYYYNDEHIKLSLSGNINPYENVSLSFVGNKTTLVGAGKSYSVNDTTTVKLCDCWKAPYEGDYFAQYGMIDQNHNVVDIINQNKFEYALSGVTSEEYNGINLQCIQVSGLEDIDSAVFSIYSKDLAYNVGDIVIYNDKPYKFIEAKEPFGGREGEAEWDKTKVTSYIGGPLVMVTTGWEAFLAIVYMIKTDLNGNQFVYFFKDRYVGYNVSVSERNREVGYGTNPRYKLVNNKQSGHVFVDNGYIYVPYKYTSLYESRAARFLCVNKASFKNITISGFNFLSNGIPYKPGTDDSEDPRYQQNIDNRQKNPIDIGVISLDGVRGNYNATGSDTPEQIDAFPFRPINESISWNANTNRYNITPSSGEHKGQFVLFDNTFIGIKTVSVYAHCTGNIYIGNNKFIHNYVTSILTTSWCSNIIVENNKSFNQTNGYRFSAVFWISGNGFLVRNNEMVDSGYVSIESGEWYSSNNIYQTTKASNGYNKGIIEYNVIYNTDNYNKEPAQHCLMDGGPIYGAAVNDDTIIRYNIIYNIYPYRMRYVGIYVDGGGFGYKIYQNLVLGGFDRGLYQNWWGYEEGKDANLNVYSNKNNVWLYNIVDTPIHIYGCGFEKEQGLAYSSVKGRNFVLYNQEKPYIDYAFFDAEDDVYIRKIEEAQSIVSVPSDVKESLNTILNNYIKNHIYKGY